MYFSFQCSEEAPFGFLEAVEEANNMVTPRFLLGVDGASIFQFCDIWEKLENVPSHENESVINEIPTLIFSGEFDPRTSPACGQLVAENLSQSQYLELPGFAHGILGRGINGGVCSRQIMSDFLSGPKTPVNASCISDFKMILR